MSEWMMFSERDKAELLTLTLARKRILVDGCSYECENQQLIYRESLAGVEFDLWKFFQLKAAHVTDKQRHDEFLAKLKSVFGEIEFLPEVKASTDEMCAALVRFVNEQCNEARILKTKVNEKT